MGSFTANAWGLHDVHGNVWEWCEDNYSDYDDAPADGSAAANSEEYRVFRGGGYTSIGCRAAYRAMYTPDLSDSEFGFRPARSVR